ncbi:MAG TPA: DUF378 domain-containing protein [Burkholderiales bacterium]|nr:DUF378 domain-containing protein [Burkholderiales bacterium]
MAVTKTYDRPNVDTGNRNVSRARSFSPVDWIAMILLIVGGINWGLVGLMQFDLVAAIFGGQDSTLSRIVYVLVGLAALYSIYTAMKVNSRNP